MSVLRPRSFLQLVLIGFTLVTLPLIIATIHVTLSVNQLAAQGQKAVRDAVQMTRSSHMLVNHLISMERSARQYQVLGDASLFDTYVAAHQHLLTLTSNMAQLLLSKPQQQQLTALIAKEYSVLETFELHPHNGVASKAAVTEFASMTEIARSILSKSAQQIDRQLSQLQQVAANSEQLLIWQALAVIVGTVLFATIFVTLISRPIRQIRQAIRRLGEGDFTAAIEISGPRDLENVGRSLDWLRTRLFDLEQAKRNFLGRVSHDLKTPLTAMREGVDLLADGVVGKVNPQQLEIVQILQDKTHHLQELIENLLNFSMAHARSAVRFRQAVPLHQLLNDVAQDHKPAILVKEVDLDISCSEVLVPGDHEQLRTVIDNLLSNAVKYAPEGGTIQVSLQCRNDCAILDVIDSGPGLDAADRDNIFDAFYQGHQPRLSKKALKGNGLGLTIVRDYLTVHHGTIEVVNNPVSGAHFRVTLPLH